VVPGSAGLTGAAYTCRWRCGCRVSSMSRRCGEASSSCGASREFAHTDRGHRGEGYQRIDPAGEFALEVEEIFGDEAEQAFA